jgi:hypothetical protein
MLLIACGNVRESRDKDRDKKMDESKPRLEASMPDAAVDAAAVRSLRLVAGPDGPRLAYSVTRPSGQPVLRHVTTVMLRATPGRAEAPLVEVPQLLPPPPAWDLAHLPSGGYELVYEVAGGALNALVLRSTLPSGDEQRVSGQHPLESFAQPRFVREAPPPAPVLAEHDDDLVVFTRPAAGQPFPKYRRITAGSGAVALTTAGGYLLFYKVLVPGPERGEDLSPGVLHVLPLSADFAPLGEPARPFGERVVYELDAATGDGRACVLATTQAGAALLCGAPDGRELALLREISRDRPLSSPALVRDGAGLAMAFIEDAGAKDARFLHVSL